MKERIILIAAIAILSVSVTGSGAFSQDKNNNNVIWLLKPQCLKAKSFSEGFAAVELWVQKGKADWGYINREGQVVIKPQFDYAADFSEGVAVTGMLKRAFYKYGFINTNGEYILKPEFDYADNFSEGLAVVGYFTVLRHMMNALHLTATADISRINFRYIDKEGDTKIKPGKLTSMDIVKPYPFREGLAPVIGLDNNEMHSVFFMDREGNIKIKEVTGYKVFTDNKSYFTNDVAIIKTFNWGYGCYLLSKKGKKLEKILTQPPAHGSYTIDRRNGIYRKWMEFLSYNTFFSEGLAAVEFYGVDNKRGFIDTTGEEIIKPEFDRVHNFSEGLASVRSGKVWGYISKKGEFVIKPQFEYAGSFSEGLAAVKINGKYGYIDKKGKIIIQPQFSEVDSFSEGVAVVKTVKENLYGFIKNPLTTKIAENNLNMRGQFIGLVQSINKSEIIVQGSNIAARVCMGDRLCLFADEKMIILNSTFPMQTITKCRIVSGKIKDIKPGMKVYKYTGRKKGK